MDGAHNSGVYHDGTHNDVRKLAVIGAGTMGAGIAQACAVAGLAVTLYDTQPDAGARGLKSIGGSLERIVKKGGSSEADKQAALARVTPTTELSAVADADAVIEAVFENLEVKLGVWGRVSEIVRAGALLASNTSSLSVTEIAAGVAHPERFCGLHFFNPVPVLPLVEVVRAQRTSETTVQRAKTLVEQVGKTPLVCDDHPGFIVNRLLIPYLSDAVFALSEGVGSAEDIDSAHEAGRRYAHGAAGTARPDRARRGAGGSRIVAPRVSRPQVPRAATFAAAGTRR